MSGGYWQQVLETDMAVPAERPLNDLTAELVSMLGSTDAVQRDHTAYPVLANWVSAGVYDDLLVTFGNSMAACLRPAQGLVEDDTVFRRSFSSLILGECIARDNSASLLPRDAVLDWADRGLSWFAREHDHRGWVDGKGWAHAIAHGADLLRLLAESRHLGADHLAIVLEVLAERVLAPTTRVWIDGEADRLAAAALAVFQRNRVRTESVDRWVEVLGAGLAAPQDPDRWPPPEAHNTSAFVRALHVHLAIGVQPRGSTLDFSSPPACRADLLLGLLHIIPTFSPWLYAQASPPA